MPDIHYLNEPGPDVIVRRDTFPPDADHPDPWTFVRANVPRTVVWHSPAGFDFGYNGSGPADLALNILQAFLPGRDVECHAGTKCSMAAARLHQEFKDQFLTNVPPQACAIGFGAAEIKAWIEVSLPIEFQPDPEPDEPKPEPIDDLRSLARLAGNLLRLLGHRVNPGEVVHQDPFKAMIVLKKVDALLSRLETDLDLAPASPERA